MIIKSTFKVVLESEDGDAEFVFRKPWLNRIMDLTNKERSGGMQKADFFMICEDLISVSGLKREDGSEVGVEDLKALNVETDIINMLIAGYNAVLYPKVTADSEKNDSRVE